MRPAGSLSENTLRTSFQGSLFPHASSGERECGDPHIFWIPAFAGMTKTARKDIVEQPCQSIRYVLTESSVYWLNRVGIQWVQEIDGIHVAIC